jgi:hypothetical protein
MKLRPATWRQQQQQDKTGTGATSALLQMLQLALYMGTSAQLCSCC